MEKRYQVFVSSTYADLKNERQKVIQTLIEMDCIPSGMELFPAADEEQWDFIKSVINDCDYYLLIIGGRYGTITSDGISYTEKEYDYAIQVGLKVIALLHENPDDISVGKSDIDPKIREKLIGFREKVASNRLVKFWNTAEELSGLVALSLSKTIKMHPAIGWIRADKISSEDLLSEINELRKENDTLNESLSEYVNKTTVKIENLADIDDNFNVTGRYYNSTHKRYYSWETAASWREMFAAISPYLLQYPNEDYVKLRLSEALFKKSDKSGSSGKLDDQVFQTIKIQLLALGLVNVKYTKDTKGGMGLFWSLTPTGEASLLKTRTVQK